MADKELLTIKDFAKRAGVSQQSLYKRLNNPNNQLNNYVKVVENQKMIDIRALQEIYAIEVEQPIQPFIQPVEQPIQPPLQAEIEEKNDLIEFLKDQLRAKDEQIESMQHDNDTTSDEALNEAVLKQLDILNEQLKAKDKQIENLQKQKDEMEKQHHDEKMELLSTLKESQENLKLAQMLQANAEKKVLQLEESKQEPVEPMQEVVEPDEEPPKGFWARIFKK